MLAVKPKKILYIEDDVVVARLIQMKLEKSDFKVDIAHNAKYGLEKYFSDSYDVVLIDYELPYFNGLQVIQHLAKNGTPPPIIMITGAGNEAVAVEAMKLGAGDYIVKDANSGFLNLLPTLIKHVWRQYQLKVERQQAIEALRESEKNLHDFFNSAVELIQQVGPKGDFIYVNKAWCDKLGYSKDESRKMLFQNIFHSDYQLLCQEIFERVKRREIVKDVETVFLTKQGQNINVLLNLNGQFKNEDFICARGMAHDITERKQAENDRERLIHELQEALAKVRTLSGMLPICASCKKIRDDKGYWNQIEIYIKNHSQADFTHSICPECRKKLYPNLD